MVDGPDDLWVEVAAGMTWDSEPTALWIDDATSTGSWFPGGLLNASVMALDRHLPDRGAKVAFFWEGEPGDRRALTYNRLHTEVVAFAAALRGLGIGSGDRVALLLGLVPETVIAILACARIGAVHAVIPAVLPVEALADRLADLRPRVIITQDAAWRHGVLLPLKVRADEAVTAVGSIEHTIVVRRAGIDVAWFEGDRWFNDLVDHADPNVGAPVPVAADHPYLITYLANRRGRPAGLVHGTAGLLAYVSAYQQALCPDDDDVLWVPSEVAWIATQTHGLLGPLMAGASAVLYEGMLDTPTRQRTWEIVARYAVTTLIATSSVGRALQRWGHDQSPGRETGSIRRMITAGEPVTDDTESWLSEVLGRGRIDVANAWGQTELGGTVALTSGAGAVRRLPDAGLQVVDEVGQPLPDGEVGDLVVTRAWPAIAQALWQDGPGVGHDANRPDLLVTEDRAVVSNSTLQVLGRTDRVFSVSGQLVSAAEVADVLTEHPWVIAAEVVDRSDPRRGRAVVAFVVVTEDAPEDTAVARGLTEHVRETLGGLATPSSIVIVEAFPDLPDDELRRGLDRLAATVGPVGRLDRQQVDAAVAATEQVSGMQ